MSVNRYAAHTNIDDFKSDWHESKDGPMVRHEDYAALEARCAALDEKLRMINELIDAAEQVNKLAQEATERLIQERNALAAENESINFYLRNGPVIRKGGELAAAHQFAPETPATDAFLAEVRAHDLNAFIRHHSAELDAHIKNGGELFDEKSVRIRDIIVSARLFREQIRKEAAQ